MPIKPSKQMVQSAPKNYLVYLARGRYRRQFDLPESGADFQKALELAEGSARRLPGDGHDCGERVRYDAARQILEAGLKKAPASAAIYEALASSSCAADHTDQAVEILERGLESSAEKSSLRWILANILAQRGDTGKLLLQIEELKKIGLRRCACAIS